MTPIRYVLVVSLAAIAVPTFILIFRFPRESARATPAPVTLEPKPFLKGGVACPLTEGLMLTPREALDLRSGLIAFEASVIGASAVLPGSDDSLPVMKRLRALDSRLNQFMPVTGGDDDSLRGDVQ